MIASSAPAGQSSTLGETPPEFLSREECHALLDKSIAMSTGGGETSLSIDSSWSGAVRWARNRPHVARDVHETELTVTRVIRGAEGRAITTRLDEAGIRDVVREAERNLVYSRERSDLRHEPGVTYPTSSPAIWSDATYASNAESRAQLVRDIVGPAETAGLLSAGELVVKAMGTASVTSDGLIRYYPATAAQFSSTVRNAMGTASGWAGRSDYAFEHLDVRRIAECALDKCKTSTNPVAIEPGRYTAILEPQAVADLLRLLVLRALDRRQAEMGEGPFAGQQPGTSKITEQVLDRRLTLSADPMDPIGGFVPFRSWDGTPYQPTKWIDQGILTNLSYERWYALPRLGRDQALPNPLSFRLSGGTTSMDEMIRTTERGVLVTRLTGVRLVDFPSMTCSGYTRDGLWFIERGKISKAAKNFRFTESPLIALNNVEQLGEPARVFSPGFAWVAPALKVRDFSFTSLADSV